MFENVKKARKRTKTPSTENSLRLLLIVGQCFALIPVKCPKSGRPIHKSRFKWTSPKTLYSLFSICGIVFVFAMGNAKLFQHGFEFDLLVENIFYFGATSSLVIFLHLALNWDRLMTAWRKVDNAMECKYGYPKRLEAKMNGIVVIVMFAVTVEYLFSIAFHTRDAENNFGGNVNVTLYFTVVFRSVFTNIPYSIWVASFLQIFSVIATFTWTYVDLFIIIISIAISSRFKQITIRLHAVANNTNGQDFWMEIREDYNRLCNLCRVITECLSYVVFTSFATNLFFVLTQFYKSIRIKRAGLDKIYFFYSFGFLICRTVAVSLFAANVNSESKEPAAILNSVPSTVYNNEIRRLLVQISFDNVGLTGCKMFKVTKGLILNVAGAIVTYELLLIQFNSP